jgi:quercetin dioxygenase-like cupin family protein
MSLRVSEVYAQTIDKAHWSHAHGRSIEHILPEDIQTARLFSYGFRAQTIGVFHATRVLLLAEVKKNIASHAAEYLEKACSCLEQLGNRAVDPIMLDHRALISTLYFYDRWTNQVDELLSRAESHGENSQLQTIHNLFLRNIQQVLSGNGIYIARDLELPEQGAFVVPDLDISIAPLVYGDYHSWNAAFLACGRPGVAVHRHHMGAEIHLGYSPTKGETILGGSYTQVNEGYAMPIPPMTDHGFLNTSGEDHVLPFVFGSFRAGGWGVYFDVEPRPGEEVERKENPLESVEMNQSVFLERAISRMTAGSGFMREVLVPAHRAGSEEIGGLELALTRGGSGSFEIVSDHYKIISVQSGEARIRIGDAEARVSEHDHFGIPANTNCHLTSSGTDQFVFLDAMILPVSEPEKK